MGEKDLGVDFLEDLIVDFRRAAECSGFYLRGGVETENSTFFLGGVCSIYI